MPIKYKLSWRSGARIKRLGKLSAWKGRKSMTYPRSTRLLMDRASGGRQAQSPEFWKIISLRSISWMKTRPQVAMKILSKEFILARNRTVRSRITCSALSRASSLVKLIMRGQAAREQLRIKKLKSTSARKWSQFLPILPPRATAGRLSRLYYWRSNSNQSKTRESSNLKKNFRTLVIFPSRMSPLTMLFETMPTQRTSLISMITPAKAISTAYRRTKATLTWTYSHQIYM